MQSNEVANEAAKENEVGGGCWIMGWFGSPRQTVPPTTSVLEKLTRFRLASSVFPIRNLLCNTL